MTVLRTPRFFGPHSELVSEQYARLTLMQELRRRVNLATQLLAQGRVDVQEAMRVIQAESIEEVRTGIQERRAEQERKAKALFAALLGIKGIGKRTAQKLVEEFGSMEALAEATPAQLELIRGVDGKRGQVIIDEIRRMTRKI